MDTLEYDCKARTAARRAMTPEEEAEHLRCQAEAAALQATRAAGLGQLRDQAAAHPDPLIRAMAHRLGLV